MITFLTCVRYQQSSTETSLTDLWHKTERNSEPRKSSGRAKTRKAQAGWGWELNTIQPKPFGFLISLLRSHRALVAWIRLEENIQRSSHRFMFDDIVKTGKRCGDGWFSSWRENLHSHLWIIWGPLYNFEIAVEILVISRAHWSRAIVNKVL